jgi:hypothetical protein
MNSRRRRRQESVVFKPQVGDLIFMALAVVAMVAMLLMGRGRKDLGDSEAEIHSIETYLRQINDRTSPLLTLAIIIGLGGVAYVAIGVYARLT